MFCAVKSTQILSIEYTLYVYVIKAGSHCSGREPTEGDELEHPKTLAAKRRQKRENPAEPGNKKRDQTAGSGLAGRKERRLAVGCGDDDVTQRPTSKLCVCGSYKIVTTSKRLETESHGMETSSD